MGDVPHSMMTGEVIDISPLCNFGYYKWIKYRKIREDAYCPYPTKKLGQ